MDLLKDFVEFYEDLKKSAEDESNKYRKWLYDELNKEFGENVKLEKIRKVIRGDASNKLRVIEQIVGSDE